MLVGQSPGIVEGLEGRPWRGRAGRTLRSWLELDEGAFYATFYCCSVTRCYPGRSAGGRGDRVPSRGELDLCSRWLDAELRLLDPQLVVTVGGLAARRVLGLGRLTDHVGERLELGSTVAIPLPHPSGASGWHNDPANRDRLARAVRLIRSELHRPEPDA
jgi:uracil-DNA glycosylase